MQLSIENATAYARKLLKHQGKLTILEIEHGWLDHVDTIDIFFTLDGGERELLTVWKQEDGSLYGEW